MEDCDHTFYELAKEVFPKYLIDVEDKIKAPHNISNHFCEGKGYKTALSELNLSEDFQGVYVILHSNQVIYVGISQKVIQRLIQHTKGINHNQASLAYKIAKKQSGHNGGRRELALDRGKEFLQECTFAFMKLTNPVERNLFEAFLIMHYKTKFNDFETH